MIEKSTCQPSPRRTLSGRPLPRPSGRRSLRALVREAVRSPRRLILLAAFLSLILTPLSVADILHLQGGGSIEGEILSREDGHYRVRTRVGALTIAHSAVERIEESVSPFPEYEARVRDLEDSPDAHFALAAWCAENDLSVERRRHLRRAIELAPDHAAARSALGFVRVGELWVDGAASRRVAPAQAPSIEPDEAQIVEEIRGQWTRQLRAIRLQYLESSVPRLIAEGRARIRRIADPLAVLPLCRVLSEGGLASREALVEALTRFPDDEATMNLALLMLTDNDAGVRRAALVASKRRNDPRVAPMLIKALRSGNDALIRRAAIALGEMQEASAVPDLVGVLSAERRRVVEVPVGHYFGFVQSTFCGQQTISLGARRLRYDPGVGVFVPTVFGSMEYQERDVTMLRTEALEALKRITGQNFGFDQKAWRQWLVENSP